MDLKKTGTLYICPTPIGNLEDMTLRVLRILKEVQLIAAEDTRHTQKLLNYFDIKTPLFSYHEHNKKEKTGQLLAKLLAGEDLALVSDAGMPGISDPGEELIKEAAQNKIKITPLPGANAALTALAGSGLNAAPFTFVGFLPKTAKKRRELLARLKEHPYLLIFYEAPHRLPEMLAEMLAALGDRRAVAARELTKKFEEFLRGSLSSLSAHFQNNPPRGEFTILVEGAPKDEQNETKMNEGSISGEEMARAVTDLITAGENKKDAIRKIASQLNISKRTVYQAVLKQSK